MDLQSLTRRCPFFGACARLIELGMQLKKPVVVILFTTSPKNGPWMPKADAVIAANYPQNGGAAAIADTLLGRISPGGRLPVTWHKHWNCSIEPCAPVVRMVCRAACDM